MNSQPLTWEDPPDQGRRPKVPPVDEEQRALLRANPQRWAKVRDYSSVASASMVGHRLRNGRWPELAPSEWEVVARQQGNGAALYVRYIGEEGP